MGFRFMHAADLHVDSPFRGMSALPPSIRDRVRESTFRALDELVRLALRERVDFVVVSGDVYDASDRSLRAQLRLQAALRQLASGGVPVFIAHGNHDPADGRTARLDWPESVRFFAADRVETVPALLDGDRVVAEVHGRSFGSAAVRDNLALGFRGASRTEGAYQIAVLHANVDGDEGHDNYAPCSLRDLTEGGFDYWALGHIHTRRVLHERPWVVYPGNPQGRSVRETGARGCYIVDVSEAGETSLTFHALDDVRWAVRLIDIAPFRTEQELLAELAAELEQVRDEASGRPAVARLVLEGRGPLHAALRAGGGAEEWVSLLREEARERADSARTIGYGSNRSRMRRCRTCAWTS
ncbi:metallophosphoesterase family protein [Gordoniibacillus kamchatkensis]|uniref:metallophosphoesterase family protein n=1 Tax=Gordoniibacillus kamchatkensis TaxID=1590651 RepID=UPI000697F68E|nr:DNA repair exonuclease [Paenibacillus sp. VKM B-2647]